ncbi:methyl-accepting chemotaxis protein [Motilimonas eburnea]|uniref:methyl-accepting chemotaxis protein n=1 Tax=Motilimonas eburnea TaxID=1737488 RepID=UPI001E40688A|nr:methyl-accepting chemotaxis protein [Motilimonas eburnea]MCE2572147.1 methyl-accepting chemotaxis protein [Motilimonas eburnea]
MKIKHKMLINTLLTGLGLLALLLLLLQESSTLKELGVKVGQAEQLNSHVLALRKHEKDFLARLDLKYQDKFNQEIGRTLDKIALLSAFYQSAGQASPLLNQLANSINTYQAEFSQLVTLQQQLGLDHKSGLHGELRQAAHQLEKHIKQNNNDKLLADYLMIRRSEKDFMQRHDLKYAERLNQQVSAMLPLLSTSDQGVLTTFGTTFNQYVSTLSQLGLDHNLGLLGQMRSTIKNTEDELIQVAQDLQVLIDQQVDDMTQQALILFIIIIVILITANIYISRIVLKPVDALVNVIEQVEQHNDLSLRANDQGKDELNQLGRSFNHMLENFQHIIDDVNKVVGELSASSEQLSLNANRNKLEINKQLDETDQVATAVTEMGSTIEEIAQNTENAAQVAESTNNSALEGKQSVEDTLVKITQLSDKLRESSQAVGILEQESQTIDQVLEVIKSIAEQTNLLALNAAIEAARAGEQGRGFAVVADEVRSLALRTQESTHKISEIIDSLQQRTRSIVSLIAACDQQGKDSSQQAELAGQLLNEITQNVSQISDMSIQVAAAIEEQSLVSNEVNRNIVNIKDSAQASQQTADDSVVASEKVLEQATKLHQAVKIFKI